MKDNDGLITCPYIGDLLFCPSQACLKNYKLKSKMTKRTEREEFEKMLDTLSVEIWSGSDLNKLWSYFQSKQQEKIEEIKKLTKGKGGTKYGIWADGYLDAIKKVLEILER